MRAAPLAFAAWFAAFSAGCAHAPGYPPDPIPRPTAVSDFASLYNKNCAACHGPNGQNGPAIDLANPEYQALIDDATLRKWISSGMPGTEMSAFAESKGGTLTSAQVDALIKGMRQQWSHPNIFAATPPTYAQSQPGDPAHGHDVYSSRCASCHQSPQQDITSPNYLALVTDQALRSIVIAGRPDIGQPDWLHDSPTGKLTTPLSGQEVDDLVAYLAGFRNSAPQIAANTAGKK